MEDEEILQYIESERANNVSDLDISAKLQMKGVSNYEDYLKKKDDTSISPSVSGEEDTESGQSTSQQAGQGAGSSVVPVAEDNPSISGIINGQTDSTVDPISGQVITPWTDTPSNKARLEITPVYYDGFQKTGFVKTMELLGEEY